MKKESMTITATLERLRDTAVTFLINVQVTKIQLVDCGLTLDEAHDLVQKLLDAVPKTLEAKTAHIDELINTGLSGDEIIHELEAELSKED